ncbi:MAG: EamA family transporter [Acidobacteriales bacterium]|nr:EamA family transporter [Terriglobales bacterium]
MKWALVAGIVASTVAADLLQTIEMKRHGEIDDFRPGALGRVFATVLRRRFLILAVFFMALSFFCFLRLLAIADLSFAVPVTAATYVVETVLAKYVLREQVNPKRWAGVALVACGVLLVAL